MTAPTKPTLLLDVEKYEHYLAESGLSESEKQEFLQTVWNMVCEFVLLGFDIHPLQELTGDKSAEPSALSTLLQDNMLSSIHAETTEEGV